MRKLFTFFLALVTVAVVADEPSPVQIGKLYYTLNTSSSTAEVVAKPSGKYTGDIEIPASVEYESETFSVTSIAEMAFYECVDLTAVTLPNSVRTVGNDAFYGCSNLESVVANDKVFAHLPVSYSGSYSIAEGIKAIAGGAFHRCNNLVSVTIPKSVTSIGDAAFRNCVSLTAFNVASDNIVYCSINGVIFSKDKKTLVAFPSGKKGSYTVPNGVESIAFSAFIWANIETVILPNSLLTIEQSAFYSCEKMKRVTIPNIVTKIGKLAFIYCEGLEEVVIGSGVKSIEAYAFYTCSALKSITCKAVDPPTCPDEYVFKHTANDACLYVPQESITFYRKATGWNVFKDNTYPMEEAIDHVTNNATSASRKLIRNGQILIERNGKLYNVAGAVVE